MPDNVFLFGHFSTSGETLPAAGKEQCPDGEQGGTKLRGIKYRAYAFAPLPSTADRRETTLDSRAVLQPTPGRESGGGDWWRDEHHNFQRHIFAAVGK